MGKADLVIDSESNNNSNKKTCQSLFGFVSLLLFLPKKALLRTIAEELMGGGL